MIVMDIVRVVSPFDPLAIIWLVFSIAASGLLLLIFLSNVSLKKYVDKQQEGDKKAINTNCDDIKNIDKNLKAIIESAQKLEKRVKEWEEKLQETKLAAESVISLAKESIEATQKLNDTVVESNRQIQARMEEQQKTHQEYYQKLERDFHEETGKQKARIEDIDQKIRQGTGGAIIAPEAFNQWASEQTGALGKIQGQVVEFGKRLDAVATQSQIPAANLAEIETRLKDVIAQQIQVIGNETNNRNKALTEQLERYIAAQEERLKKMEDHQKEAMGKIKDISEIAQRIVKKMTEAQSPKGSETNVGSNTKT
ncbi:MAG: hypothetical protein A3D44_02745 [Candidatus Staskawiczbacteria bacterium RIFCSPHIGHO2_02_FULL_42_22]|uniref:Uncharacterized protein n=1 Tax=Candidatus Staskawiczbacteria bacterium RIFCSPHIGHO2_02_FULL_42_22 TaxID=1802207 RepID=A0A1G2I3L3_9BACT|nr:MAG: hypothetical protein A3D44_02745 [Candidatus Staskawiczbacteria bacterium RIFCSPHIGHO2_02_FULL_42_22]